MSGNFSTFTMYLHLVCLKYPASSWVAVSVGVVRILLFLPLCTVILYLAVQRRRQGSAKTSHSDVFTYNMVAMQLLWILAFFISMMGAAASSLDVANVGVFGAWYVMYGEMLFHALSCVERYLAVVHPITYMSLKDMRGIWTRNVSIGLVWLLSFGCSSLSFLTLPEPFLNPLVFSLGFCLIVALFCTASILAVLIRPGPGEGGGAKKRVDQSKRRALHTVLVILGVQLLWLVGLLVASTMWRTPLMSEGFGCVLLTSTGWFNLPSGLVLPLLYLHRAGKLTCCF